MPCQRRSGRAPGRFRRRHSTQEPLSEARPGKAGADLIGIVNGKSRDAMLLNGFADGTVKVALQGYAAGEVAKDIAAAGGRHQDHVR